MNSGGDVLKRLISLSALLLSISLFLSHGTSFSNAEIKNDATLSIVPEEHALIAITYGKSGNFSVKNNTAKTIDVANVEVVNEPGQPVISMAEKGTFTIIPVGVKSSPLKGIQNLNWQSNSVNSSLEWW